MRSVGQEDLVGTVARAAGTFFNSQGTANSVNVTWEAIRDAPVLGRLSTDSKAVCKHAWERSRTAKQTPLSPLS